MNTLDQLLSGKRQWLAKATQKDLFSNEFDFEVLNEQFVKENE